MYGWYGDWGVWGWVVMGLTMFLVRGARGGWGGAGYYPPDAQHDDPLRILGQRFARGEIDETEYRARLEALRRRP